MPIYIALIDADAVTQESHTSEHTHVPWASVFIFETKQIALQEAIFQGGFYFSDKREAILASGERQRESWSPHCELPPQGIRLQPASPPGQK